MLAKQENNVFVSIWVTINNRFVSLLLNISNKSISHKQLYYSMR